MPFYVGQEVEAVADSARGLFRKGERFIIEGIQKGCPCLKWVVNVGLIHNYASSSCHRCGGNKILGNAAWIVYELFRAITPAYEAVTFEKIEEPLPSLN